MSMGMRSVRPRTKGVAHLNLPSPLISRSSVPAAIGVTICFRAGFSAPIGPSTTVAARVYDEYVWDNETLVRAKDGDRIVASLYCGASVDIENGFALPSGTKRTTSPASSLSGVFLWRSTNTNTSSVTVNFTQPFLFSPSISVRLLNSTIPYSSRIVKTLKGFTLFITASIRADLLVEWTARESGLTV